MSTVTTSPRDVVSDMYDAFSQGDVERLTSHMSPHVVWHESGRHPLAGQHVGVEGVLGFFGAIMERTQGTFRADLVHLAVDGEIVYAYHRSRGERDGRAYDIPDILRCTVQDGLVTDVRLFCHDQGAEDALLA
jgi:uncharacterized protein